MLIEDFRHPCVLPAWPGAAETRETGAPPLANACIYRRRFRACTARITAVQQSSCPACQALWQPSFGSGAIQCCRLALVLQGPAVQDSQPAGSSRRTCAPTNFLTSLAASPEALVVALQRQASLARALARPAAACTHMALHGMLRGGHRNLFHRYPSQHVIDFACTSSGTSSSLYSSHP